MEEFQNEELSPEEVESPSRKRKRVEMLCSHCGVWVLKSTYYRHQRDYGIVDGGNESDSEKEREVFAGNHEAEEQFENDDDGHSNHSESKHS